MSSCGTAAARARYDRSRVTTWIVSGTISRFSSARLTRSRLTTRGSWRSEPSSCPCPASTAYTRRAPARNNTRVKPPAAAPTSSAIRSETATSKAASATSSFASPRRGWSLRSVIAAPARTSEAAFVTTRSSTTTAPRAIAASGSVMDGCVRTSSSQSLRSDTRPFRATWASFRRLGCWPSDGRRRTRALRTAGGCVALQLDETGHGGDCRPGHGAFGSAGPALMDSVTPASGPGACANGRRCQTADRARCRPSPG